MALMARFRSELAVTERTREVARIVLRQLAPSLGLMPAQAMTMQAAVALLPGWAGGMHGCSMPVVARPLVRAADFPLGGPRSWARQSKRSVFSFTCSVCAPIS